MEDVVRQAEQGIIGKTSTGRRKDLPIRIALEGESTSHQKDLLREIRKSYFTNKNKNSNIQ